jgi:hypothetical protein
MRPYIVPLLQFTSKMEGMVTDLALAREKQQTFEEWKQNSNKQLPIDISVTVLTTGTCACWRFVVDLQWGLAGGRMVVPLCCMHAVFWVCLRGGVESLRVHWHVCGCVREGRGRRAAQQQAAAHRTQHAIAPGNRLHSLGV